MIVVCREIRGGRNLFKMQCYSTNGCGHSVDTYATFTSTYCLQFKLSLFYLGSISHEVSLGSQTSMRLKIGTVVISVFRIYDGSTG